MVSWTFHNAAYAVLRTLSFRYREPTVRQLTLTPTQTQP